MIRCIPIQTIRVDLDKDHKYEFVITYVRYIVYILQTYNLTATHNMKWCDAVRPYQFVGVKQQHKQKQDKQTEQTKKTKIADHHFEGGSCQLYVPWSLVKSYCFWYSIVFICFDASLFYSYSICCFLCQHTHNWYTHIHEKKNDFVQFSLSSSFHLNSHHF